MIPTPWLFAGAAIFAALHVGTVLVLLLRNALVDLRLRRERRRSGLLSKVYDALEAERSPVLRRELARREILRDIKSLEMWLDLVASRGHDPAELPADDYEHAGVVSRASQYLRSHRHWTRRAAAAEILGWTGSASAAPALLECVKDDRGEMVPVRAVALRSLGRIRHPDIVPPLIANLDSTEPWFPPMLADTLVALGTPAVEPLAELLADPSRPVGARRWAAQILGDIKSSKGLMALQAALNDVDAELRAKSAKALGELGDERSVELLLDRLLVDPIPFVRSCVAKALAQLSTEKAIEVLLEALGDSEWWVRLRAVEGLAQVGEPARDMLLSALHDRDPQVSREAARALESQGVVREMLERLRRPGYDPDASEFLIDVGKAGNLEPLLDELESLHLHTVRGVVRVLSRVGDRRAGAALVAMLGRPEQAPLRARVIDALRRVKAREYIEEILEFLRSDDEWIRKAAVDYVGELADADVLPVVLPMLSDVNPWIRESCLRLVQRLRPLPPLDDRIVQALDDDMLFVRAQAVRTVSVCRDFRPLADRGALDELHVPEILGALLDGMSEAATAEVIGLVVRIMPRLELDQLDRLERILTNAARFEGPEHLRSLIAADDVETSALGVRWTRAVLLGTQRDPGERSDTLALFDDEDARVRAAAVAASHPLLADDAVLAERVIQAVHDESPLVVRGAVRALALAGLPDSDPPLRRCLRHRDRGVKVEATFALALTAGRRSLQALTRATHHRLADVRLAAVVGLLYRNHPDAFDEWLRALTDDASLALLENWRSRDHVLFDHIRRRSKDAQLGLGRRLILCESGFEAEQELLLELESSPDTDVRRVAVQGLEALPSGRPSGKVLSAYRRDPSPEVRVAALQYLVSKDVYGQRLRLIESALRDPVDSVRIRAVHLTVTLPDEEAIRVLVAHLSSDRVSFRDAVTDLLAGRMEEEIEPVLDEVMGRTPTAGLLMGLIAALDKVVGPISTQVLQLLLDNQWATVRGQALRALVPRLREQGIPFALQALDDPAPSVRLEAIRVVLQQALADDERVERFHDPLLSALNDPDDQVRTRAALTLGRLGVARARRPLEKLQKGEAKRVARAAQIALGWLTAAEPREVVPS